MSEWEEEKRTSWEGYLDDELNFLTIKPSTLYIGCEYANHLRMKENIVLDKTKPVRDQSGNVLKGIAKVTHYHHVELLEAALKNKVSVHQMEINAIKFKLEASVLDDRAIGNVITKIQSVGFASYENIDVLKL